MYPLRDHRIGQSENGERMAYLRWKRVEGMNMGKFLSFADSDANLLHRVSKDLA